MSDPRDERRALYLRWRPRRFADVVGQEHVVRTLRNAAASGRPAHAYLLCGPRGTGKTSLARIFYRALNCARPEAGDPCGACEVCEAAIQGRALDLVEIDAASNRGIDDIRQIRERVAFSPSEARYRVYIIDEAHELTAPAWDAFLKTLEEPPQHTIFVLATTEAHKVPSTIVSRCQRFDLRRIPTAAIREQLARIAQDEALEVEPGALERLARMGRGGLRDAISLLDQAAAYGDRRVDLGALREMLGLTDPGTLQGLVRAIVEGRGDAALEAIAEMVEQGADLRLSAEEVVAYLRALAVQRAGAGRALHADLSDEEIVWLRDLAPEADGSRLRQFLLSVSEALARIRDAAQFQLHFELAVLEVCEPAGPPIELPTARLVPLADPDGTTAERPMAQAFAAPGLPAANEDTPTAAAVVSADVPGGPAFPSGELSADGVRSSWARLVEAVARRNAFIASYLQPARVRELRDGCLTLSIPHRLHHAQLGRPRNRDLVEEELERFFGRKLQLRCELAQDERPEPPFDPDDPFLQYVLEKFGGELEPLE